MSTTRLALALLLAGVVLGLTPTRSEAFWSVFKNFGPNRMERLNGKIGGRVYDHTDNHGVDRRICSKALGEKRDLYVYVPPGYDGKTQFPFMLWLHGFGHDEKNFLDSVPYLDEGIRTGAIPPMVIVAPDASVNGKPSLFNTGSFYLNSKAGRFEDLIIDDIVPFAFKNYAIRPEREAHVIAGASMGGYGAYSLGFKHKELFGSIAGIMPPLNMRYIDCHGKYMSNYDPNCVAMRNEFPRFEVIGRFYGVITVRQRRLIDPLFGRNNPDVLAILSANNPIELLETKSVRPDDYKLFIGYAGQDEFNLDAQAEHFLDVARKKGICPDVIKIEDGHHRKSTGVKMFPALARWLTPILSPYTPAGYSGLVGSNHALIHAPLRGGFVRPVYLSPLPSSPTMLHW